MKPKISLSVLVSISFAMLTHRCCLAVDQEAVAPCARHKESAAEFVRSAHAAQEKAEFAYEEINSRIAANPVSLFRSSLHRPGPRCHELAAAAVNIWQVNRIKKAADEAFHVCQQWHDSPDGDCALRRHCHQAHDALQKLMRAYDL